MRAICVAAARPNLMKIKPVIAALESRDVGVTFVHTGQHYDTEMDEVFFRDLGLRAPDIHLGIGSGTHAQHTARVMEALEPVVEELCPDVVVVVGDVNSTMAAALVAAKSSSAVAHVEAGLRSGDWSMPEEVNRVVTDRVSDVLFAPSADAVANLSAEATPPELVHLVGNVMVDTLLDNLERARSTSRIHTRLSLGPRRYGVVTLHRPSNVDDPAQLKRLVDTFARVARTVPLVWPLHPRARAAVEAIGVPEGLTTTEPLGYLDFLALEADAAVVLTDSGGVQEETTVLGVACLTLRETTERPITVSEGTNEVVGRDAARIEEGVERALRGQVAARCPALWDGKAAERIGDVLITQPWRSARR